MFVIEAKMVWARSGGKVTRKFRCTVGRRKGRTVSNPSQCNKPVDLKKRFTLRRTRAQRGARMTRKAQRTKRYSPQSRMVRRMNR